MLSFSHELGPSSGENISSKSEKYWPSKCDKYIHISMTIQRVTTNEWTRAGWGSTRSWGWSSWSTSGNHSHLLSSSIFIHMYLWLLFVFSMLGAFTFLLAMLIPNIPSQVPRPTWEFMAGGERDYNIPNKVYDEIYGGHFGELYRLFLASMLSIFIYVLFFKILNQALLWIAPLHYAALLYAIHQVKIRQRVVDIENRLNQSLCSLPPLWLSFSQSGSPPLAWATVSEATNIFSSPERSL